MATQAASWISKGIALAVVGLIIGVAVGYFVYPAVNPAPSQAPTTGLPSVIKIGAILSLSGDLASYGQTQRAALQLAQIDINNWLATAKPGVQVQFVVEDTATKPDQALSELQTLAAQGIKFFIGPVTSAELKNIINYAQSNQLIIVSVSSTSMELAVPKPFIFRFDPPDKFQAYAIARAMWEAGIRYVVIVARHDSWGDSLSNGIASRWQQLGGQFEIVQYPPETKDFSAVVADLNSRVSAAIQKYGADKVGVVLNSFDEGHLLIDVAATYPTLSQVRWFGSDATQGAGSFISDTTTAEFNIKTKMIHPVFNPTFNNITLKVRQYIVSQLGRETDNYAYIAYDAAWILVKAILEVNAYDPVKVNQILAQEASSYFGASGWIPLDSNNDRVAGDYAFWTIIKQGGQYKWVEVGIWSSVADSVTYYPEYAYLA
jgi:ABC-type branched-chain amino acid transport systems, periplasmic component